MSLKNSINRCNQTIKRIAASALSVCLIATGIVTAPAPAYAASDFTTITPFDNTQYGKGSDDNKYTHNGAYAGDLIVNGVDVSWWQDNDSNWVKAKKEGVDFAILRVSYTSLSSPFRTVADTHFYTHYKKLREAGTDLIGVYAYSQAKSENEAASEASFAVKRLKSLGIGPEDLELPVYMDYEFGGGRLSPSMSMTTATKCAKAFCEVIRNAGYKPGIYASTNFYKNYINLNSLGSDVDIWCAQYYYKNTLSPVYTKWQYSSTATIDKILSTSTGKTGGTDVDFWYVDMARNPSSGFRIYGNTHMTYTGKPVKPSLEVYYGNRLLTEGKDYTISGITNIALTNGEAYAYVMGIGKYSGYAVVPFSIGKGYKEHIGLNNAACKDSEGVILSNKHIVEEITKYLVRFVDEEGKDIIDPAYYENGTVGAEVKVPAPEKEGFTFTGWLDAEGNNIGTSVPDVTSPVTYTAAFEPLPETAEETVEPAETVEDAAPDETQEELEAGTADADATEPEETAEEATDAAKGEPKAVPADADGAKDGEPAEEDTDALPPKIIETVDTGKTYLELEIGFNSNGSYVRNVPEGKSAEDLVDAIQIRGKDDDYSLKVIDAKYAEVTGSVSTGDMLGVYDGDKLVGTADITVNGSLLSDTGSVHLKKATASKVAVAKTSVKKLKKYKKAFKVTVSQKSYAYVSGYQVKYSTRKDMSGAKIKTIGTSYSKVSKKIKGLKAKKRYYVQVRSYKVVNGKKYYSGWSAKKSVKTK